jgi:hypothetical protein
MSDNPLARTEFLVVGFDSRDASLTVLNNLGYSARNRDDAIQDAEKAATNAQAHGLPVRYVVVRIAAEAIFPA